MFLVIEVWQKILPVFCSKNDTTFHASFLPYLSNAVEIRDGSYAKMIRKIWRLQPHPQWLATMKITILISGPGPNILPL